MSIGNGFPLLNDLIFSKVKEVNVYKQISFSTIKTNNSTQQILKAKKDKQENKQYKIEKHIYVQHIQRK